MTGAPRSLLVAFMASLLLALPAAAQTYDADWAGVLKAGPRNLRLVLHVKTEGGATSAVIDSLDQGASLPAAAVKTEGGQLSILFLSIGGELKARLTPDGKALEGTWEQGGLLPLTLTKQPPK